MFQRCAALAVLIVALTASGLSAQDAESLVKDGIDAFRRGDNAGAAAAFKAALATNPGQAEAFRLWERAEQQELLEMLASEGELGALAERFLGLARVGRRVVASDPGGARDVVARLLDGDLRERQDALLELQSTYGEWAVPALVGPLGDRSDIDRRVAAIQALIRLGDQAVIPLTQVLQSEDELTRANAAAVLGALGDVRAAAGLAWTARMDASDVVRGNATEALDRLAPALASVRLATNDPMLLTQGLVERWIVGDPQILRPYDSVEVRWTWADGALQGESILSGLYALVLAEGTLRQAIGAGAGDPVRANLAAVHAAMAAEIEAAAELDTLVDNELIAAAQEELGGMALNLALAGPHRGPALQMLMELRQVPAAETLIASMGASPHEVASLRLALSDTDGTIALAAAKTLAGQGVTDPAVVARLGHALTTVPDRIAMMMGDVGLGAAPDGWQALDSENPAQGLLRAKSFPPKDVVIVQDGFRGVTLDALVFGLHNDPRTADVPIVVVTQRVDEVERLYSDEVALITDGTDWDNVITAAGMPSELHQEAMEQTIGAAEALLQLPASAVRGASREIGEALASSAGDEVKAVVLQLAEKGRLVETVGSVEAILEAGGSRDLQLAALNAAARLWAESGGATDPSEELVTAVRDALESDDEELSLAAAHALGQMGGDGPGRLLSVH